MTTTKKKYSVQFSNIVAWVTVEAMNEVDAELDAEKQLERDFDYSPNDYGTLDSNVEIREMKYDDDGEDDLDGTWQSKAETNNIKESAVTL